MLTDLAHALWIVLDAFAIKLDWLNGKLDLINSIYNNYNIHW